jgi:uncharacterized repeat protein (TIGR01451 family)
MAFPSQTDVGRRFPVLLAGALLATLLMLTVVQTLAAQSDAQIETVEEVLAADLSGSSKTASATSANAGDLIAYTVIISNSGNTPAAGVVMTDTLPAALTYESGSLSVSGGGLFAATGGIITWTGAVNNGALIEINFSATVSATDGTVVTNTAVIDGPGPVIERDAAVTVNETPTVTGVFLPLLSRSLPMVTIAPIAEVREGELLTVQWSPTLPDVTYELQESLDPAFPSPTQYSVGEEGVFEISQSTNRYYYRVRPVANGRIGAWSNVESGIVVYRDDFNDVTSGWAIRQQDTDDNDNYTYYENGFFVLKIDGRWDYAIASPLRQAPIGSFSMEMDMRLDEPKNLNAGGMIWGADWNGGEPCPDGEYDSCFNHYYRLVLVWYGSPDRMRVQLKRIDFHDPIDNSGRGDTLLDWMDVFVGEPAARHIWRVDHLDNGDIKLYVDGKHFATTNDSTYLADRYFGIFASTGEYLGAEPTLDWFEVRPLD